jgi:hypothetical protein
MNIRDRFLHWILPKFFEYRDVIINEELYLRRYFLRGRGTDEQWFLHNIRKPDEGRDLHDHPWDFTTRVLLGWYREDYGHPDRWIRKVSSIFKTRRGAKFTHGIREVAPGGAWTLVKAGRAKRIWGFWEGSGEKGMDRADWVPWRTYLGLSLDTPDHLEDALPSISISTKHLDRS